MPQCCAVPFCSEVKGGHMFPKDKTRQKQWVVAICRDNYTPSKHSRVCKKHFNPDDYALPKEPTTEIPRPLLKKDAVPSQFPWNSESGDRMGMKIKPTKRAFQYQKRRTEKEAATLYSNAYTNRPEKYFANMTEKICRLCLKTIIGKNYHIIEESLLKTLKLNLNISKGSVICTECSNYLQILSSFKTASVYMKDAILSLPDQVYDAHFVPVKIGTTINLKSPIEAKIKCSFCTKTSRKESFIPLNKTKEYESLVNILKRHILQMNLNNTEELLTCETCLAALQDVLSFILKCLKVEEKISKYAQIQQTDVKGQIELKAVQQFLLGSTTTLELQLFDAYKLEDECDQIKIEYTMPVETEIKYEEDLSRPELIIKTELEAKTEVEAETEQSNSGSFQDPLETSVVMSETRCNSPLDIKVFKCEMCSYETNCKNHLIDRRSPKIRIKYNLNRNTYKYCIVPDCQSTSVKTPNKIFLSVPRNSKRRRQWQRAMKREKILSIKSTYFVCEDHFNLEADMENYMYFKLMDNVAIKMKPNIVPHIFNCQLNRTVMHSRKSRTVFLKRQRQSIIEELIRPRISKELGSLVYA